MRHAISTSNFATSKKSDLNPAKSYLDSQTGHALSEPLDVFNHQANSGKFSLRNILATSEFFSGQDVRFSGIANSADTAQAGELVVYRIGEACPSQLIADAMARGAAGILTEQILPCPLPQCIVGDVDLAIADITADMLGNPDQKLLTVGVIGSAGKTTSALLIASLLRSKGIRVAYQTDLGACDGVVQSTPAVTVASGSPLVEWLGEATDTQCQAAVIEILDDDARHGRYDAVQFDMIVVANTASVSSDFGPSGLQCLMEQLKPTGMVIASSDDSRTMDVIHDHGSRLLTYGLRNPADLKARIVEQSDGMATLMLTQGETSAMLETGLCGSANASNLAAAALVGVLTQQPLPTVCEQLAKLPSLPGRGQRMYDLNHANVVIDAAGSPERAEQAMKTARSMKRNGRLWCVLSIMGDESAEELARYGSVMERYATNSIATCHPGAKSSFLSASHNLLDGVEHCVAIRVVADQERAVRWAVAEAKPTDTVLVIGGIQRDCAHEQRTQIAEIQSWVESERDSVDAQSQRVDSPESKRKLLSIFVPSDN